MRSVEAHIDEHAGDLVRNFATSIDQRLDARMRALDMLAASPLLDDESRRPELYRAAQSFQRTFGAHVILTDVGEPRRMLFHTRVAYGEALPSVPRPSGHAAIPAAIATGKPAVGDSFLGPIAQELLVGIAVPVLREGRVAYVLGAILEARQFQARLDQQSLPEGWAMSLLDGGGAVIARRAPPGFDSARDVSPTGRFVAASELSPWSVVLEVPRRLQRETSYAAATALGLALLATTLAGVLGGLAAGRRLTRAVVSLTETLAPGESVPRIAEIDAARGRIDAANATLRESEARFRRLFEEAPLAMGHVRGDGVMVALNRHFTQLFGYSLADVPTLADWWRLAYPDPAYRSEVMTRWSAAMQRAAGSHSAADEYRVTCKDGSERIVQISGIQIDDGVLAAFIDMTEARRAEAQLRLWGEAFEHAQVGVAISDARTNTLLAVNPTFARERGYRREELVGMPIAILFPEELREDMMNRSMALESHGMFETEHVCKDGRRFPVLLDLTVLRGPDGSQSNRIAYALDLTERKRAEASLRALNQEMEQLTRRHVASQTVAAMAHELNQPLMALATYTETALLLLRGGNRDPDRLRYALEKCAQQTQRAGHVARALLAVLRKGEVPTEAVDANELVRGVLTRIGAGEPPGIQFRLQLEPGLRRVSANRLQIEKVLANLLENAIDALRGADLPAGSLAVTLRTQTQGEMVQVSVSDRGPGMDADTLRRIFDPFFTTKAKGLGMGLAISRAIVESQGGRLWCDSAPGAGASFHLTLPFAP